MVCQGCDILDEMRRDDEGHVARQSRQEVSQLPSLSWVEPDGRLVQYQERGLADECLREQETLLHAPGEGLHPVPPAIGEVDSRERALHRGLGDVSRDLAEPRHVAEEVLDPQALPDGERLRHDAEVATYGP